MGFYVDENNKVWADHAIKEFGDTTADNNPTFDTTYCDAWPMRVTSVFKRFKFEGKGKPVGDNCPFIYGVKRKQGLSVGFHGVAPLISPLATILAKFAADCVARGATFDAVLPMPSSHKIAAKNALYLSIRGLQTVESLCLFSPVNGRIQRQKR